MSHLLYGCDSVAAGALQRQATQIEALRWELDASKQCAAEAEVPQGLAGDTPYSVLARRSAPPLSGVARACARPHGSAQSSTAAPRVTFNWRSA